MLVINKRLLIYLIDNLLQSSSSKEITITFKLSFLLSFSTKIGYGKGDLY